ncbi:hypothetical protein [Paenibacillus ihumii]|uniref:hypothetical protein n=1 Tax=Paenibacillus ihumii TaxID=687436 RepID=UPI0006D7FD95|nr:hypothetical protein [Paenibacillus ihumii]
MDLPSWLQGAIQERLEQVMARIERQPELRKLRDEESLAFEAMLSGADRARIPGFMDWEDKHHFRRGVENEQLYIQGLRDGVQLAIALLESPESPNSISGQSKGVRESVTSDTVIRGRGRAAADAAYGTKL